MWASMSAEYCHKLVLTNLYYLRKGKQRQQLNVFFKLDDEWGSLINNERFF